MKKLSIVFNPKFQASSFVIDGLTLPTVEKIPLIFKENRLSYFLYGITLALHLYSLAFQFRYTKATRIALKSIPRTVLFWDSCYFEEYQMLESTLNTTLKKNVFLWNPMARWSSNIPYIKQKLRLLQHLNYQFMTFDPRDASFYDIPLVKNVHRKIAQDAPSPIAHDFYFIGYTKGRKDILANLESRLQQKGFRTHFILIENKAEQITQLENIRYSSESACIVDIVSPNQTGLTLRPFDALFLRKKLLTNNPVIRDQDFYNSSNIFILQNMNLEGIEEFMKTPYYDIAPQTVCQYEINQWIQHYFLDKIT